MTIRTIHHLPVGNRITVSVEDGDAHVQQVEDASVSAFVTNTAAVSFGPYILPRSFRVIAAVEPTVSIAEVVPAFVPVSGTIGDLVEIIGTGAPTASAQATADMNPAGDDNGLTFTAVEYGSGGNLITVEYIDPGAESQSLTVSTSLKAISVSLATDGAGDITSTAAEVKAAVEANARAAEIVTVVIDTDDTGVADDGSGVVAALAATALAGGAGTGVGTAGPGSRYTDIDDSAGPALYINTGTKAQPVWSQLSTA
jgi:hypothetical protein